MENQKKKFLEFDRTTAFIAAAIFLVFTVVIILFPAEKKDFGLWSFYVCGVITEADIVLLNAYLRAHREKNDAAVNYAQYVPPIVAFLVICAAALILPPLLNYVINYYLMVLIVIFAISFIVQVMMLKGRTFISKQEEEVAGKRFWRDEIAYQWKALAPKCSGTFVAEAKEIAEALRFSDPMGHEQLLPLEARMEQLTEEIKDLVRRGGTEEEALRHRFDEMKELLAERNDKCRRLK